MRVEVESTLPGSPAEEEVQKVSRLQEVAGPLLDQKSLREGALPEASGYSCT